MIKTAKTLLLGVIALVKHKHVNAFKRLDKQTYFLMLKKFFAEESNELAWINHFLHQIFKSNANKAIKIIQQIIDDVSHFVRFLTPNGFVECDENFSRENESFLWLRGVIYFFTKSRFNKSN